MHFHAPTPLQVELVCATRMSEDAFWETSALGCSLAMMAHEGRIVTRISYANRRGLSEVYNEGIERSQADILVFLHDDLWLQDLFLVERILAALSQHDLVGLAGNTRRVPHQYIWCRQPDGQFDLGHMSGVVWHGATPFTGETTVFGPAPQSCELLDGLLLAVRRQTLLEQGLRFDPRFSFHFYDMDFCRQARDRGLRLGTFLLSVTHQSSGRIYTADWEAARDRYFQKWRD